MRTLVPLAVLALVLLDAAAPGQRRRAGPRGGDRPGDLRPADGQPSVVPVQLDRAGAQLPAVVPVQLTDEPALAIGGRAVPVRVRLDRILRDAADREWIGDYKWKSATGLKNQARLADALRGRECALGGVLSGEAPSDSCHFWRVVIES